MIFGALRIYPTQFLGFFSFLQSSIQMSGSNVSSNASFHEQNYTEYKIRYSADIGQLKFLQALTKVTTQRVEFSCNNGTRDTELDNVIKILGINGKEVPRKSRWPRLDIHTDCKAVNSTESDGIGSLEVTVRRFELLPITDLLFSNTESLYARVDVGPVCFR